MQKMRYVGVGADGDPRTMTVEDHEVAPLEATGLWKKVSKKASENDPPKNSEEEKGDS